jgi:hypothetical protein
LFPPDKRDALEFSFVLSSCLDIFEARIPHKTADQDFGLLQALDERLATYGWLTNTGVKFIIVIDMEGRPTTANDARINTAIGLRDSDVKPVRLSFTRITLVLKYSNCFRRSKHYMRHTSIYLKIHFINPISIRLSLTATDADENLQKLRVRDS